MTEVSRFAPGSFCWVDLATTDAAAAKRFYGELLGWGMTDGSAGANSTYTMASRGEKHVAALYQMGKEEAAAVGPHWNSYVSVVSARETAARAAELGGRIVTPPFDVADLGRMAVLADPAGATICLWEPRRHRGADLIGEPGAMCWNELLAREPGRVCAFYEQLFGWAAKREAMGGSQPYTLFENGSPLHAGGMLPMQPGWGPLPSHCTVYFMVEELQASVKKAERLGGSVLAPPMQIANVGHMAMVADPQGADFCVIQMSG